MINVLFVCLGNICRSPMAEGVFRQLVEEKGLSSQITCDSAGTAAYHSGSLPDKRARKIALEHGLTLSHHARQLAFEDFQQFDYIMAMDESNFENIRLENLKASGNELPDNRLFLYRSFDSERGDSLMVPDPYYHDLEAFEDTYQIVLRSGTEFLLWIIEKHGLQATT